MLGAEGGLERAGAAGLEACVGGALELYILDAALLTELTLGGTAALGIDDEDVGLDEIERGDEVDDSTTLVDIGFLDGLDILDHKQTLLLGKHGFTVLVFQVGSIRADTYIEVSKLRGLLEKLYMTAMEQIIAAGDENEGRIGLLAVGCWLLVVFFHIFSFSLFITRLLAIGCWF